MRSSFDFIADPGHGWLKVTVQDLAALKLSPTDFSTYSYRNNDALYLEEDSDAGIFINAWRAANPNKQIKFRERVARERQSRVRNYPHNSYNGV